MPGSLRRTVEQGRKWGPFIETYKLESLIFRKTNRIVFVGIFKVWPNASPFYWIGREVWTAYIWKESGVFWLGNAKCNFSSARESLGSDPTWLGLVHIALIDRARRFELRWILTSLTKRMTHSLVPIVRIYPFPEARRHRTYTYITSSSVQYRTYTVERGILA